jgi:hypothetical protein
VLSLSMPWRSLTPSARGCSDSLLGVIETVRALIGFHYMFPRNSAKHIVTVNGPTGFRKGCESIK